MQVRPPRPLQGSHIDGKTPSSGTFCYNNVWIKREASMSVGPTKPKGQHFLPRFLLGRFASRTKRGQSYVFLFRRGERQVEANVSNVAKARYFYGDPATSALEEKLAGEESVWA